MQKQHIFIILLFTASTIALTSGCVSQRLPQADSAQYLTGKWAVQFHEEANYHAAQQGAVHYKTDDAIIEYRPNGDYLANGKKLGIWELQHSNILVIDKGTAKERYYVLLTISAGFMVRKGPFYEKEPRTREQVFVFYCKKVN